MKLRRAYGLLGTLATAALVSNVAHAETIHVDLDGYQVAIPGTISTAGSGFFRARIDRKDGTIEYELSYQDLEGDILQSHIHLGRPATNGGIFLFLCTNLGNDPAGTAPLCPGPREGMVTRTVTASEIVSFAGVGVQGIAPGELDEVLDAIDAGAAYVVVHTTLHPPGELRGDIPGKGRGQR